MKRQSAVLLCLGLVVAAGWSEDPPQGTEASAKVKVCGLQVAGPGYGTGDDELRPLNTFGSGTSVALLVTPGAGTVIRVVDDECKVLKFADDKGTDLLKGEMKFGTPGFGFGAQLSKDGKAALMEVRGPGLPSPDATSLTIEGTTAFLASASGKTDSVKAEGVELKKDGAFTCGAIAFTIREAGKPQWGDDPMAVELTSKASLEAVKSVKFLDAAGKEIESQRNSSGREAWGSDVTWSLSYTLKQKVDKATVVVESWSDAKKVFVPVIVKVKLGL